MARWATILCTYVFVSSCGFETGSTDRSKAPWEPGPLGGKADAIIVDKGSIGFGDTLAGVAIHEGELHRYAFFAVAGSKLRVTMTAVTGSGYPDTFLQLATPGGDLYTDDDGGVGFNSRLEVLGLPDSGTYTLYATTYLQAGTGDYDLALECLGASCASAPQSQSDDDHDGFSEAHGDCDDGDPDVSPEAPEIPGNLRDDNCNGKTDEGCNDPVSCDRPPRAPRNVTVTGNYDGYSARCRVTGEAEPNTKLTVYSNSRRTTLASNHEVPATGGFSLTIYSNCPPGDVLVLQVADQTSSSGKVWVHVSGLDTAAPMAATGLQASVDTPSQVTIQGEAELGTTVLLTNTSTQGSAVEVPAGGGFKTAFVGVLAASAGDWIQAVARDGAGNIGPASHVRVPGADGLAPAAPFNVNVTGNHDGYTNRCRVTGNAEPFGKLTIYSNSRRTTLTSNHEVSATGGFSVTIYSNCAPGDVLQLWVSDGVNDSAKELGTVSGIDSSAPIAPGSVSVSAVQSGQVTVTATAEIFGELVVTNTYDGAEHVAPVDSSSGTASMLVPAWHGDTLELRARDAAGNTGPASLAVVP